MRGRITSLDGLRALAAFGVLAHHAPPVWFLKPIQHFGWVGVDVFLALSGYLVATQLGAFGLSKEEFLRRRLLRIAPLYWGFVLAIAVFVPGAWWLGHVAFVDNVVTAVRGYADVPFTAHLWTISLEVQFYFAMALGFGLIGCRPILVASVAVIVALIGRTAATMLGAEHPFVWALPLRVDPFVFGCLLALLPRNRFFVAFSPLILAPAIISGSPMSPAYQIIGHLLTGLGAAGVVALVKDSEVLSAAPLAYLGRISFGIYVFHLLALFIAAQIVTDNLLVLILGAAISTCMAAVSYRFYEQPIYGLKSWRRTDLAS